MIKLAKALLNDEAGFVVSSELVLVGTIGVLGMTVGLSELSMNVNQELEDVGTAIGSINQSYDYSLAHGNKGFAVGSRFVDTSDACDNECDINCDGGSYPEYNPYR